MNLPQDDATKKGVSDSSGKGNEETVKLSPREEMMNSLSESFETHRSEELAEALAADPGLASIQAGLDKTPESSDNGASVDGAQPQDAPPVAVPDTPPAEPGTASTVPMHEEPGKNADLPQALQDDALADFIRMDGGKPMVALKVNGQEKLVTLDKARQQMQKHIAAEILLDQNNKTARELKQREQQLLADEQALQAKLKDTGTGQPSTTPDVDPGDLMGEAKEVISSLFTGTEDEAAAKLANVLAKNATAQKGNVQPQIDPNAVAEQAATIANARRSEADLARETTEAYNQFQVDYADILGDQHLFRVADGLTDDIAAANPTWRPAQIMQEAGRQTREWAAQAAGKPVTPAQPVVPVASAIANAQNAGNNAHSNRQANKEQLVPIPAAATARHDATVPVETAQTPAQILAEQRAARGQGG